MNEIALSLVSNPML